MIADGPALLTRLCNDQDEEDGLLRLVPNDGKELVEFTRSKEVSGGADLKVVNWGAKGVESSKYARVVPDDTIQTFRNFVNAIVSHQVNRRMHRDGLLVLFDEFDVIPNKNGVGSLIKSLTSDNLKFGVCGIGHDLMDLIKDHGSVERLLEQGAIHVKPMSSQESIAIVERAEELFKGEMTFSRETKEQIARVAEGYPYFVQLLGKECVAKANEQGKNYVDSIVYSAVMDDIQNGRSFPTLERSYQRAIGSSEDRRLLLHLLADQPEEETLFDEDVGRIFLKKARKDAEDLDINHIDQLIPRLLDSNFGPALARVPEKPGVYDFVNPVFRLYVRLRQF